MAAELGGRTGVARAVELVREAIRLLDSAGAPSDIAAHLDLAAARLDEISGFAAIQGGMIIEPPGADRAQAN